MDVPDAPIRRRQQPRERQPRPLRTRLGAVTALAAVIAVIVAIVLSTTGSSGSHAAKSSASSANKPAGGTSGTSTAGKPGTASVPILVYHVINVPPVQSTAPQSLYVPVEEFTAEMNTLKSAGWRAVTLDQLEAYWTRGTSLGTAKPIVISFDGGYSSQYTNALPVLKQLGWVGVLSIPVNGLPSSDGGLTDTQTRGLIAAGWELGSQGVGEPDLTVLGSDQLRTEVATSRDTLHSRYNVPVNWFSYPSGDYDSTVTAAVSAAGYTGATTSVAGWASPKGDRFRLPRLQVTGGTTPSQLLSQIASAQQSPSVPSSFQASRTP